MSKKLAAFMVVVCVGLIALVGWFRLNGDRTGPEITCNNTSLVYREGMKDAELLENVIAFDEKDGDVSDSLTVESAYMVDDDNVCIVYVAKDYSNNITKVKQIYSAEKVFTSDTEDNETQDENDIQGENTPASDNTDETENAPAEDAADETENDMSESAGVENSVNTDSADSAAAISSEAEQARSEQEAAAAAMPAQNPRIYLTDYVVTIPAGTSVDRLSYVKEITDDADNVYDLWTKIQITGSLDTLTAGTYECTYYVIDSAGNTSNQAVLKFIVQ